MDTLNPMLEGGDQLPGRSRAAATASPVARKATGTKGLGFRV